MPALAAFGIDGFPIWPWTTLGYAFLSFGFVAAIRGHARWADRFWAVSAGIALIGLVETLSGHDFGVDRLLFPQQLRIYPMSVHPGRPGNIPVLTILILSLGGIIALHWRGRNRSLASLIASAALGLGLVASVLVLFSDPGQPISRMFTSSLPAGLTTIFLAVGILLWSSEFDWVRLLTQHRTEARALRLLIPGALLLPVLPSLLDLWMRDAALSPVGSEALVVLSNMAIVTILFYWAIGRMSRDQAELSRSEERLAVATSAHELGVFEWHVPSGKIHWSPGAEQRLGLAPGALSDFEHWRDEIEPEDFQRTLDTIARAVADHADKFSFRYRFRQTNGSVRAVEGSSRTFYDHAGNLERTVGVIVDVTEREEREAALRARQAQLRSVLETVPDPMVVIDQQGTIQEFSRAAEEMWGYAARDVLGRNFTILAPESDRLRYEEALARFNQGEPSMNQFIGRVVTGTGEAADGRRFPVEIRTGAGQTDSGTIFTIFVRDLSEQLATEERLSDLNAELIHVSRQSAMSELAADLAHELNQPLSATANFLAAARMLLERGQDQERAAELVRMGGEQTLRAGEIIRRLRNFMARREVDMRAENVEQTVRDAVELVLVGTGQFDIRVSYDFDPSAQRIYADRVQVQQVLVNLLRNATDALRSTERSRREIVIASRPAPEGMVEIRVRDTGPGLPESILKQLYTRFVTTKAEGGMGIGLSISRRIVEAHGGILTAENRPEGGACFRFTLPALQQEDEA